MPRENRAPAWQMYALDDVLGNGPVAELDDDALGAHIRLQARSWNEGPLPLDHGRLARFLHRSPESFARAWEQLRHLWRETPDGYVCDALEAKRDRQAEYREQQRVKGERSAAARSGRGETAVQQRFNSGSTAVQPERSSGSTEQQPGGNSPTPTPTPSPSPTPETPTPHVGGVAGASVGVQATGRVREAGPGLALVPAGSPPPTLGSGFPPLPARRDGSPEAITEQIAQVFEEVANGTRRRLGRDEARTLAAGFLFNYWAAKLEQPHARLDTNRERLLVTALAESGDNLSDLLYAIDGALRDRWHNGSADGEKRLRVQAIFRDRAKIEELVALCRGWKRGEEHPAYVSFRERMEAVRGGEGGACAA
jgi:hypothetical protein